MRCARLRAGCLRRVQVQLGQKAAARLIGSGNLLERWRAHFGPDRWVEDVDNWRLIGLNALLLGSGEREEALQGAWLETVMNEAGERYIAWFLHRPLFL